MAMTGNGSVRTRKDLSWLKAGTRTGVISEEWDDVKSSTIARTCLSLPHKLGFQTFMGNEVEAMTPMDTSIRACVRVLRSGYNYPYLRGCWKSPPRINAR